jgi:hypothetical protein
MSGQEASVPRTLKAHATLEWSDGAVFLGFLRPGARHIDNLGGVKKIRQEDSIDTFVVVSRRGGVLA